MPRGCSSAEVRWVEIAPCYVFHPLNAYEDERGAVVFDVVRYPELWRKGFSGPPGTLHRWRIDLAAERVHEDPLDDRAIEFPPFRRASAGLCASLRVRGLHEVRERVRHRHLAHQV